jgi:hypothetical protein
MELDPAQSVLVWNFINFMKKLNITKTRNLESTKSFALRKDRAKPRKKVTLSDGMDRSIAWPKFWLNFVLIFVLLLQ